MARLPREMAATKPSWYLATEMEVDVEERVIANVALTACPQLFESIVLRALLGNDPVDGVANAGCAIACAHRGHLGEHTQVRAASPGLRWTRARIALCFPAQRSTCRQTSTVLGLTRSPGRCQRATDPAAPCAVPDRKPPGCPRPLPRQRAEDARLGMAVGHWGVSFTGGQIGNRIGVSEEVQL